MKTNKKIKFRKDKVTFPYRYIFERTSVQVLKCFSTLVDKDKIKTDGFNYLYYKGDIPVMLVAHIDTVLQPKNIYYDSRFNVLWGDNSIGADDRAGVSAIFEIFSRGLRPHVLLCNGEESGGIGARVALNELEKPNVNCIIELDRRGSVDSVFYNCDNSKFEEYINSFGFKTTEGSYSDISFLCPKWCIAGVNLSIGYYNNHCKNEFLNLTEWKNTVDKVTNILKKPPKECFEYKEKVRYFNFYDYYDYYDDYCFEANVSSISEGVYIEDLMYMYGGSYSDWSLIIEENKDMIRDRLHSTIQSIIDDLAEMYLYNYYGK